MRARYLLLLLLLSCTACSLVPASSESVSNPTVLATATVRPSSARSPTLAPAPSSTATQSPTPQPTSTPGPEAFHRRLVFIDQQEQMMYVYEDGLLIRSIPCSTGKPGEETHTPAWEGDVGRYIGTFFSFGVFADHGWYLFDHYGGMLIHGAPYLIEGSVKLYQELDALGVRPASHGCIRLPPQDAVWFAEWEPQGAHVIITPPRGEE